MNGPLPMTDADLKAIRVANTVRRRWKSLLPPSPWTWGPLRDEDDFRGTDLFAADDTVVIATETAWGVYPAKKPVRDFIVYSRNDQVEDSVDLLLREIERLKRVLGDGCETVQ